MPELRKDPVIGRWVIIATERAKRPQDFLIAEPIPTPGICPFCPGNEELTPPEILAYRDASSIPNTPGWSLRVVPNKYPALKIDGKLSREGMGIYDIMDGVGAHEVIIDSPSHTETPADLPTEHVEKIILAYKERMCDLRKDERLKYILIFKNHRSGAGASLDHPHSQLIATPITPKRVKEELHGSRIYYEYKERCIFCDIIKQEIKEKERVIADNAFFLAFCPYASRFPFEICIIPKSHSADFSCIDTNKEVSSLAAILKYVLASLKRILNDPPYNYIIHTTPLKLPSDLHDYHWHIEIIPRITRVAGFEWGSGFYINPTAPEEAAKYLREE